MYPETILAFLALANSFVVAGASPIQGSEHNKHGQRNFVSLDPEVTWSMTRCAELPKGVSHDDSSVQWEECDVHEARMQKRAIICDRDPNGCSPTCSVSAKDEVHLNSQGIWWTRWCHAGGLHTHEPGSLASVAIGHSTTVGWSGEVSLAGPVSRFLDAKLGFEVSRSRSVSQGVGCINQDGQAHSVWLQEEMGWADSTVFTTATYTGQGCEPPGQHTYTSTHTVHADYPDPYNTGFRGLLARCSSPDDGQGPWCNLDAQSLQQD